ncbi:heparinase II/III family protein [Bosea sp. (in: a-proteobacteria)]|uniref:heparinase II/III family protein n=1 Tax=Bosea sp. (in: a-proteobacteria) TaxID=1871050 RepID=UPI002FC669BB
MKSWSERGGLARAAIGRAAKRTRGQIFGARRALWPFGRLKASRLLFAPHDLRTADPTTASDIYSGYFAFAGRTVNSHGESPFEIAPPSEAWAEALHGFSWLRHLRAADTAIARANARALVEEFIGHKYERGEAARQPAVAARRLISFLSHSPLLLEGADHVFYERFIRHVAQTTDRLQLALAGAVDGVARLQCLIAVSFAAISLDGQERRLRRFETALSDELERQILPDGGHLSRNPRIIIELLLDLLPLRETFAARGMEPPRSIIMAIDRMMPHLRLFRHGDGALALFNGMGATPPDLMATLAAYDDARGRPIEHAAYAGYDRLSAGPSTVIVDAGAPPRGANSVEAHAGCLSFEFSSGAQRLVVNCGASRYGAPELRLAARATAAHSTVTLDDRSSCVFGLVLGERRVTAGPADVRVARQETEQGIEWVASHDGYKRAFGVVHTRRLLLAPGGRELVGEDEISPSARMASLPAAARFHLHPNVKASLIREGEGALLALPSGEVWAFEASGLPVTLEESVFFAAADGRRRTSQLIVDFDAATTPQISWRFARLGAAGRRAAAEAEAEARQADLLPPA